MIADAHLSAKDASLADACAARNPHLPAEHAVLPDTDVVRNMHEIVDLHPVFDDRVGQRAAVDGRIRADLDIVTNPDAAKRVNALYSAFAAIGPSFLLWPAGRVRGPAARRRNRRIRYRRSHARSPASRWIHPSRF